MFRRIFPWTFSLTAVLATFVCGSTARGQQVPVPPAHLFDQRKQPGVPAQVTLTQAIAIAAATSPALASARATLALSDVPLQLARTAILPNISGSVSSSRASTGTAPAYSSVAATVTLQQLVYDGGKMIAQLHGARAGAIAGSGDYERAFQTLQFNVAQAYYAALRSRAVADLALRVLRQDQVQEALVRAQVQAGTASRVDLATAQFPTAQARVALVNAEGANASALAAFANTLGLDADVAIAPASAPYSVPTPPFRATLTYSRALQRALLLRPDYAAALATVQQNEYGVQAARAGILPALSASVAYGTSSTATTGTAFRPTGTVGLKLDIPLFDQGITRAQTSQAQAQLALASAQLEQLRLNIGLDVRQATVNLITADATIQQAQAELAKAREVLAATQAQYRAGVTTLPLLLNAQVGLTTAQTDEVNATYGLAQAEASYAYALGENLTDVTNLSKSRK